MCSDHIVRRHVITIAVYSSKAVTDSLWLPFPVAQPQPPSVECLGLNQAREARGKAQKRLRFFDIRADIVHPVQHEVLVLVLVFVLCLALC